MTDAIEVTAQAIKSAMVEARSHPNEPYDAHRQARVALEAVAQMIEEQAEDDSMAWQWQEGMRDAASMLRGVTP